MCTYVWVKSLLIAHKLMRHEAKIKNQLCPWNFIQCFRKTDKPSYPYTTPRTHTHIHVRDISFRESHHEKKYIYEKKTWRILLSDFLRSICNFYSTLKKLQLKIIKASILACFMQKKTAIAIIGLIFKVLS